MNLANNNNIQSTICSAFKEWNNNPIQEIIQLPHSGSSRIYFRIITSKQSIIAVYNNDIKENLAFLHFTDQFVANRINVPVIHYTTENNEIYFIDDLGDTTFLSWLNQNRVNNEFPKEATNYYKIILKELIKFQVIAGKDFDYTYSYPFKKFNRDSILYDLNYYKTQFVDNLKFKYNNDKLKNEFELFADYLLSEDNNYFMYRDFQARNIMLHSGKPYFIDYQGGRKGPLQYDVASLLYQAKAEIPETIKTELLNYYIEIARMLVPVHIAEFKEYFYAFALIRVLQTLGAYGLRGLSEKKQHFIESIPMAINNLKILIEKVAMLNKLPELKELIYTIINTELNFIK